MENAYFVRMFTGDKEYLNAMLAKEDHEKLEMAFGKFGGDADETRSAETIPEGGSSASRSALRPFFLSAAYN